MTVGSRDRAILLLLSTIAVVSPGCEVRGPEPTEAKGDAPVPPERSPESPWQTNEASTQIALPAGAADEALEAAVREARDSAEAARQRWMAGSPASRGGWAVKWSAPTVGGGVEHIWVVPLAWSPFRVEGTLASPPAGELESGRRLGEIASFPIEQLVDWVRYENADFTGAREGGYTIDALEERFGKP